MKRLDITSFLIYGVVGAHAVAAVVAMTIVACEKNQPAVTPNPNAADCLSERQIQQLGCVKKYKLTEDIDLCKNEVRSRITCTSEAGIERFITSSDAGAK